jgi:hypothetical protein
MTRRLLLPVAAVAGLALFSQQRTPPDWEARRKQMSIPWEQKGLAEPFKGVTTNGTVQPGLFGIRSTGVSTAPVRQAAEAFLASLTPAQRTKTKFPVDSDEWRKWMNQDFYYRQGVGFNEMDEAQRAKAFGLLKASLSAKGLQTSRDIMRLNYTLGELNGDDFVRYGEWLYWITVMGEPSADKPWGWQIDGHHLIINYFVLGDQVVMTPTFMGSEPVIATSGKYKGTSILQDEQKAGLEMIRALTPEQRSAAILEADKPGNNNHGEAFKDNIILDYAGIRAKVMTPAQQQRLLDLAGLYIANMPAGHAKVRIDEVKKHIADTWFAWIGGTDDKSVFYYRIQSPVILIEFDHQRPVGIRHHFPGPNVPVQEHIHTVVRTPNGNDYGKDLLRQHYATHQHPH